MTIQVPGNQRVIRGKNKPWHNAGMRHEFMEDLTGSCLADLNDEFTMTGFIDDRYSFAVLRECDWGGVSQSGAP
jgi:hypothetical protein